MTSFSSTQEKIWLNADDPTDDYRLYSCVAIPPKKNGTIRLWVDGCFDMMHFGHANALRQAIKLGMDLVRETTSETLTDSEAKGRVEILVGCHSDEEVAKIKGPPIMLEEERYEALRGCKWTNYVVENAPYNTRLKDIDRFGVNYVVHGDDISLDENGNNSYQEIIDSGRLKIVKRTESISTTELVGRMLLSTRAQQLTCEERTLEEEMIGEFHRKDYLTSNRKIVQFSNDSSPKPSDKIVYIDGFFDLFHVGHIHTLRKARALGDYLIVGLYNDCVANSLHESHHPVMTVYERMLCLLSCRYVDEVVFGVNPIIPETLLDAFRISVVAKSNLDSHALEASEEHYRAPKERNILVQVNSTNMLTTARVIQRVVDNRVPYIQRQVAKSKKEVMSSYVTSPIYTNVQER